MNIRYKVQGMMAMAQYATMNDLFFAIDPEGWANIVVMTNQVNGLVNDWNGLHDINELRIDFDKTDVINQFKWGF